MNQHDRKPDWVYWFIGIAGLILLAYFFTPSAQAADDDDVDSYWSTMTAEEVEETSYGAVVSVYSMTQNEGSVDFGHGYIGGVRDAVLYASMKVNGLDNDDVIGTSDAAWNACQARGTWHVDTIVFTLGSTPATDAHQLLTTWMVLYIANQCPEWLEVIRMSNEGVTS